MKLINTEFDHRRIDDSIFDKKGRVRMSRKKYNSLDAVDFEDAENALESLVGDAYRNERQYHPAKQGMRRRYRGNRVTVDWWDERPGGAGRCEWHNFQTRLYGLIEKYVGKKFDDCFSALKERYMTNKDWRRQAIGVGNRRAKRTNLWMGIRNEFLDIFSDRRRRGDYYVDNEGIIRKRPSEPKRRHKDIYKYEGEAYYVPNYGAINNLRDKLNDARVDITMHTLPAKVPIEFVRRWESSFRTLSYWQAHCIREACFRYVDEREVRVIKWHSKEWYDIKGRSGKRRRKKPDNSAYYDRSLWVQNYLRKHNDRGLTFHKLMEFDPEEIRWDNYIDVANNMLINPTSDMVVWGRRSYIENIKEFIDSVEFVRLRKEPAWDYDFQFKYALREYIDKHLIHDTKANNRTPLMERFLATTRK